MQLTATIGTQEYRHSLKQDGCSTFQSVPTGESNEGSTPVPLGCKKSFTVPGATLPAYMQRQINANVCFIAACVLLCLLLGLLLGMLLCATAAVHATTVWRVFEKGAQRVVTAGGRY